MKKVLGSLAVMLVALAGCSTDPGGDRPASDKERSEPKPAAVIKPSWTTKISAVGQPVMAGQVAVVIVKARDRELDILGLSATTGKEIWRHPYSPGDVATGYGLYPSLEESSKGQEYVVFQRPTVGLSSTDSWVNEIVAVDPQTGKVAFRTTPASVYEPFSDCLDGQDACAEGLVVGSFDTTLRFDLDVGYLAPDDGGVPDGARSLGDGGLYSTEDRPHERIGRVRNGRVKWEVPAAALFGDGFGSDGGWSFDLDEAAGIYSGNIGALQEAAQASYDRGEKVTIDLADSLTMLGISADTGKLLWRQKGADSFCVPNLDGDDDEVSPPVRCTVSGSVTYQKGKDQPSYRDVEVTLEGFDRRTGNRTWSVPTSRAGALELVKGESAIVMREAAAVQTPSGLMTVSLVDGETSAIAKQQIFLCERESLTVRYALPWGGTHKRAAGHLRFPCTAAGKRAPGGLTNEAIAGGAIAAPEGMYLIATSDRVSGYRFT